MTDTQTLPDKEENFIYLGKIISVHFFLHCVTNDLNEHMLLQSSGDIYNLMLEKELLQRNEQVLVYHIFCVTKNIMPVIINHQSFSPIVFPTDSLEKAFKMLVSIHHEHDENIFIIVGIFKDKFFHTYKLYNIPLNAEVFQLVSKLGEFPIQLQPLKEMISTKTLPDNLKIETS